MVAEGADVVIGQPTASTLIAALLAKGADVNARSSEGKTALLLAAERGRTETVSKLLQSGADVDAADASGQTAVERAAREGHREIVADAAPRGRRRVADRSHRAASRSSRPRAICSSTRRAPATRSCCAR